MSELKDGPADIKFADELFEELGKLTLEQLMEKFELRFYANACGAIGLFEKVCLKASNNKARAEAAKYFLNLFRDQNLMRNLAIIHEIRVKGGKPVIETAVVPDNSATWKGEPETEKK
jgi:hypothetical protein